MSAETVPTALNADAETVYIEYARMAELVDALDSKSNVP